MHTASQQELLSQLIDRSGSANVQCTTSSMEPTVVAGDEVCVERCTDVRRGDVVLLRSGDTIVLHRVLWYTKRLGRFAHIGDRPGSRAGISRRSNIVGKAALPRRAPRLSQHWSGLRRLAKAAAFRFRRAR